MKLKNKKVLVFGLGDSGRAVIKLLNKFQAHVSFYDDDVKYYDYVGFERNPVEKDWDLVVLSPGVKILNNPILDKLKEKKVQIISELDFAYLHSKGKIVAVTGTNGKTTVSMLTNKILHSAGYETFLCGNIGLPFSAICDKTNKNSVIVCEVSNFQLEGSLFFRANVSCILNIQPDHIDRHGSFEEYVKVKGKIANNLRHKDVLILNLDDEHAKKMILHKKLQFFSKNHMKKGVSVSNNQIFINRKSVLSLNEISLKGEKNLENVLASVAICSHFKVSCLNYSYAIKNFAPATHRMEMIGGVDGVTYVDDSKATNVASTLACVETFKDENIWLLLGGQGKDVDYAPIFNSDFVYKKVVCFGEEGEKIAECAKNFKHDYIIFSHFNDAVKFCVENSENGDFVLLSPACASFDEFSSYAERGECFKNIVLGHANEK